MAASDSVDISKVLSQLGVDPKVAADLNNKMNGVDYLNLANAVGDNSVRGQAQAKQILAKYGINLAKVPQMNNTRLESIFSGIRQGKAFEEATILEHIRPVSEMNSRAAELSGYSSFVRAANDSDADMLRDWLDENEVDYQNNDKHTFLVQSADRDATYKLNHFMGRMNGKTSVMDDQESVEEAKKMAKDLPKTRNPFAQHAAKKGGAGVHVDKDKKRDAWDRSAKHKKQDVDPLKESSFAQGEVVMFGENEVPVHIPAGPNGTIGLLIDGKVKMVREGDITRTDEGVMGMTKIDPLYRLRELAGIRGGLQNSVTEDDFETPDPQLDVADDFDDMDPMGGDDLGAEPVDIGAPADGDMGMENDPMGAPVDLGGVDPLADPMGGNPGDLPPMGADGAMGVEPTQSQAYTEIVDHLNNIQNTLGDVKLSEYRSLVAKLEDLAVQIKGMGRDYLGEMRKLKK